MSEQTPEIKRINRISGQISGVRRMLEGGRDTGDVLRQTRAIRAAVKSLEAEILRNHIEENVNAAFRHNNYVEQERKVSELIDFFKAELRD